VPTADDSTAKVNIVALAPRGAAADYSKVLGPRVSIELASRCSGRIISIESACRVSAAVQATASGMVEMAEPAAIDLSYAISIADIASLAAIADALASGSR
jgi:hypothetical protein